jgi:hypothetical protein
MPTRTAEKIQMVKGLIKTYAIRETHLIRTLAKLFSGS